MPHSLLCFRSLTDKLRHLDSWTHVVEYLEKAYDELLANQRPGIAQHLILITDGVPDHADDDNEKETVPHMIQSIQDMQFNHTSPIHTSVIGFEGEKKSEELPGVLSLLQNYSVDTWSLGDQGLTKQVAVDVASKLSVHCPGTNPCGMTRRSSRSVCKVYRHVDL